MILKTVQQTDKQNIDRYTEDVIEGVIYERIQSTLVELFNEHYSRSAVKREVLRQLYADNRLSTPVKLAMKKLYPGMSLLVAKLKRGDKYFLPKLMQSIEAFLVVDVVAKRISEEYPDMPIFTIHDNIATTVGNEAIVKSLFQEEIGKMFGASPSLRIEQWNT